MVPSAWVYRFEGGDVRFLDELAILSQTPARTTRSYMSVLRHLGAFGLFAIAILDSTPVPTFGGADILTAVLAARRGEPWYYFGAAATLGSVIGASLTFHLARGAGLAYLGKRFGERRVATILKYFERWGTGALFVTTLVPFPFPTTSFFAAAGVLGYPLGRFLIVVATARAVRFFAIAAIAAHYGRHFVQAFRHPGQYAGWLILIACFVSFLVAAALYSHRRLNAEQG
jgi:membrane protein YqaA with SNARE-associated domain